MSATCVAELESALQSMQELKPPGVSGPKITAITQLCVANVASETMLIQKIYSHFKKAPADKKLGVMYVVDAVTRQWFDQARKNGQAINASAGEGTFAAGVNHVTELLGAFMSDITAVAPENQKEKIRKLLDIWERSSVFPSAKLNEYKAALTQAQPASTTPPGSPPVANNNAAPAAAATTNPSLASALQSLSKIAELTKTSAAAQPPAATPQPSAAAVGVAPNAYPSATNFAGLQQALGGNQSGQTPVNGGFPLASFMGAMGGMGQPAAAMPQMPSFPNMPAPQAGAAGGDQLQQSLQILGMFAQQGIPQDQWANLLQVVMAANAANTMNSNGAPQMNGNQMSNAYGMNDRDRGYGSGMRSPMSRARDRSRSRSPGRRRDDSPRRRRDSPSYGYGRKGSPDGKGEESFGPVKRNVGRDASLGDNRIRVFSRTLFVGGVTCSENELRDVFSPHGRVQTCIVNVDKRHAFVKMLTRPEAEVARDAMEHYRGGNMLLRTKWGVGFGPRDCCDYETGISVIPIERLTEADRKWLLTAEYGGSGGEPITGGLVCEEPDIEIGAGVSSKAMSRRMQTDRSGMLGPRSTRNPNTQPVGSRFDRRPDEESSSGQNNGANANANANANFLANFPFPFPMGFNFGQQQGGQGQGQ